MAATKSDGPSKSSEMGPSLTLPQLNNLKQNLEQELGLLQDSLQSLKMAQQKFQDSSDCLDGITSAYDGKEVLIPLTGSMYVPGTVCEPDRVMINIGTGYYIEKNLEEGRDYFKRKVVFVTNHMEKIQTVGLEKSKMRDGIQEIMMKAMSQAQSQAAAQQQAAKS